MTLVRVFGWAIAALYGLVSFLAVLMTGVLMGYVLGSRALLPMALLVPVVVAGWMIRDALASDDAEDSEAS